MCVTSLLCGPRADLWPFYGLLCKRGRGEGVEIVKNKTKTRSEDPAATILENEKTVAPAGDEVAKRADR